MNEDQIVELIRNLFPSDRSEVGIGDDAAVVRFDRPQVITTDTLFEGIDFLPTIPVELMARKSLSANLSDVAAMGAIPRLFLLTMGLSESDQPRVEPLLRSLADHANRYGVQLIGGDLSSADRLMISITMFGDLVRPERPLLRSGARPGDRIFVSRPLGAAEAGLRLLLSGWNVGPDLGVSPPEGREHAFGYGHREFAASAILRHVDPEPEVALGCRLAELDSTTACIDISDGLSTDLARLCRASEVGAEIEWERIPMFPDLGRVGGAFGIDADRAMLHGGEEFALLFTAAAQEAELSRLLSRPVYRIGTVRSEPGVVLRRQGNAQPLEPKGFDHFDG